MKASQGWQLQHDGKALAGPVPSPRESSTTRDTASPSEWREGDTYKFAVYSATSPSAVTFCGTMQGTRRASTQRRWWLLKP